MPGQVTKDVYIKNGTIITQKEQNLLKLRA